MKNICVDCEENEATVADLYCEECCDIMAGMAIIFEKNLDESHLNFSLTKSSQNMEDKVDRLHPQLGCTYCKPNKGENASRTNARSNRGKSKKKKVAENRRQGSEFKKNQHKSED